jgi:hypothetical protein
MARKKHALEEGSIAEIFRRFIAPLSKYKPEHMGLDAFWDKLFHVSTRDIERYTVSKGFKMPGLCFIAPTVKIQGVGPREVKRGDILYVRTDATTPNLIDVQWLKSGIDVTYSLNSTEWGWVRLHLAVKEFTT